MKHTQISTLSRRYARKRFRTQRSEEIQRRAPQQKRSRDRVELILNAAGELLVAEGYNALTTNKIAKRAKISVGAIYQYFKNKEEIAAALRSQLGQVELEIIEQAFTTVATEDLHTVAETVIRAYIDTRTSHVDLRRVLVEQVPASSGRDWIRHSDQMVQEYFAAELRKRADVNVTDFTWAARGIITAIEAIVNHAILLEPERLTSGQVERSLVQLFVAAVSVPADQDPIF